MTEALVRSHGLAGLTAGAQVMAGLAERYWDGVFPLPDDYGMETRVAPVTGLNGRDGNGSLIQPLYMTDAVQAARTARPIAYYQYQQSEQLATLDAERRQQRIEAGAIPLRGPGARGARRGRETLVGDLLADARAARDAWQAMADVMDEKAGADGPPPRRCANCCPASSKLSRAMRPPIRQEPRHRRSARRATTAPAPGAGGFGRIAVSPGQLASREDALRALGEIANFFRRSEPHSPLSYTLDEAVRRGRMTWPELLAEVVADTDTRNTILNTLGIRPPPPPEAPE